MKPYAVEAGFSNGDGTYSVSIKTLPLTWQEPVDEHPQKFLYEERDMQKLCEQNAELLEFVKEVRRTGDTRLANMAIAVAAKTEQRR